MHITIFASPGSLLHACHLPIIKPRALLFKRWSDFTCSMGALQTFHPCKSYELSA
jgi:hypothetical protein